MLTLLYVVLIGLPSLAQFQLCNSPTSTSLNDIHFFDADLGLAVGDSGVIIRSADGGLNWDIVLDIDSITFKKVDFFDTLNAIAVGSDLFITNDGGLTWTGNSKPNHYVDISILNSTSCILSGLYTGLMKSYDKGVSWDTLMADPNEDIGLLSFIDENVGYSIHAFGGGITDKILKTTDGGQNWNQIDAQTGFDNTIVEGFSFVSEDIGFRGGWYNPHMMRTTDSGLNWNPVLYVDSSAQFPFYEQLYDFHIEKDQPYTFYACGWYGKLFKSFDYGTSWKELDSPVSNTTSLNSIFFINDHVGWAVGQNGIIIKTTNGGELVGTIDLEVESVFSISPNPATDEITIDLNGNPQIDKIEIYNDQGQQIKTMGFTHTIDISEFSPGTYFVMISTDQKNYSSKIIKK
jgi:photosystem II stability/assembly factor-like uncharacterized protein